MTFNGWYAIKPNPTQPNHAYLIYTYKEDLALLIYNGRYAIKPDQTKYVFHAFLASIWAFFFLKKIKNQNIYINISYH